MDRPWCNCETCQWCLPVKRQFWERKQRPKTPKAGKGWRSTRLFIHPKRAVCLPGDLWECILPIAMLVVPCPTFCMICYPVSPIRHAKTTTNKTIRLWTVWHTLPPRTTPKFYELKERKGTRQSCPALLFHIIRCFCWHGKVAWVKGMDWSLLILKGPQCNKINKTMKVSLKINNKLKI